MKDIQNIIEINFVNVRSVSANIIISAIIIRSGK